jgi:dihydrofolate synthase/folylpolyglutamate synthase
MNHIDAEYVKTYAFLCSLERFGILLGLENISALLNKLGNPQRSFPVVHIGGTKGKGSTASIVAGVLRAAGLKTGLYTSPHLSDFRERIRINEARVSKDEVIASTQKVREIYDQSRTTFFEFTTAVAFDCLAAAGPDVAVIEVGLGGRLDATNTVDPIVTVITDVSREHEDYLGVGVESVAREKAGIIKPGVPVITGASRKMARQVILNRARELNAGVKEFGRDFIGVRTAADRFTYKSPRMVLEGLSPAMPGAYQVKNASLALAVVEELQALGFSIPEQVMRQGVENTRFPGRFELLAKSPDVIIDGAHTPESMRLCKSTFKQLYPDVRPFLLLGMLKEKNYQEMARIIAPIAGEVVCVAPQSDRALPGDELAACVNSTGVKAVPAADIAEGLAILMRKASSCDAILAVGSLYMIGAVRQALSLTEE